MTKRNRLKQIENRMINGIGSMPENIDEYAQELVQQNNYRWVMVILVAIILFALQFIN